MIYQYVVPTAAGLESVTAREMKELGLENVQTENNRVLFSGDETACAVANVRLRTASRVQICLKTFRATTFEELFQGVKSFPWADLLPENARFPVEGRSVKSTLFSISDCQAITKKAIVEKMKETYRRDYFEESGDLYPLEVALLNDTVTLTLDTSGAGLHKRGYRRLTGLAPLKETTAAALLNLSFWRPGRVLVDPMCGTGTIPIEAALMAEHRAPGMNRSFLAEAWPDFAVAFREEKEKAKAEITPVNEVLIFGSDVDAQTLELARAAAKDAGVAHCIRFEQKDARTLSRPEKYGFVVTNPPYGERLGEDREVRALYRDFGTACRTMKTWSFYVISSHPEFERCFGRKAEKERKLFNGRLLCRYYQFPGPKPPKNQEK